MAGLLLGNRSLTRALGDAQSFSRRLTASDRLTFSAETTAWLEDVEAADDAVDGLGPMNDDVYNAAGRLADRRLAFGGFFYYPFCARTAAGGLIPLVGPAPTVVGGPVIHRGGVIELNGTTQLIDTNYTPSAGAVANNDFHMAIGLRPWTHKNLWGRIFGADGVLEILAKNTTGIRCKPMGGSADVGTVNTPDLNGMAYVGRDPTVVNTGVVRVVGEDVVVGSSVPGSLPVIDIGIGGYPAAPTTDLAPTRFTWASYGDFIDPLVLEGWVNEAEAAINAVKAADRAAILAEFSAPTVAWLQAVEAADGEQLPNNILQAKGTLADGFAAVCPTGTLVHPDGARTLDGALIKASGFTPTGVNIVSGDFNGRRILTTNAGGKYISTGVISTDFAQNDGHVAVYVSSPFELLASQNIFGGGNSLGSTVLLRIVAGTVYRGRQSSANSITVAVSGDTAPAGMWGTFRNNSTEMTLATGGALTTAADPSAAPGGLAINIGANGSGNTGPTALPVSAYSFGTYVDPVVLRELFDAATAAITAALA